MMDADKQKRPSAFTKFVAMLSPGARIAAVVLLLLLIAAVFAPWIAPYGENEIVGEFWEPFSERFWLGTDQLGRDLLTRLIYGAQNTFLIAGAATLLSFTMGSLLGFIAAVSRGAIDQLLSRLNDMMMAIPTLIFALVILSVMPSNLVVLILVMGILDSTRVFRLSRAVAVDIAVFDFVEAARLRGERTFWIISREILPNALTPLFAEFGLRFAFAVLFLSTLSFLGLGIQPPEADWGNMVRDNRDGIIYGIPAALIPAAAIATLTVSINLVVDSVIGRTSSLKGGRDA
jgi:peptide/nickel transport system permease protein